MTTQQFNESVNRDIRYMMENKAKPYAIQVCNAGAMPESFEDWIKSTGDCIDLDRTEATCKWFDELPKQLPF